MIYLATLIAAIVCIFLIMKLKTKSSDDTPVIFSEGKAYWGTFRPILKELIKQKIKFRYITLDSEDPALKLESEIMEKEVYSKGMVGFAKLSTIETPLMLATTPNIGSKGYPVQRSSEVKELVHIFHDLSGTSNYRLGGLDFYDSIIMVGDYQKDQLRKIEKIRKIKEKELVALGLPYMDDLYAQIPAQKTKQKTDNQPTILVAPSWGSKGCFSEYGIDFVRLLANDGYNIIIRLHPQSYVSEPELVEEWKAATAEFSNINWDKEIFSTNAMMQSDIMISDTSSVRFDYSFLYSKPVITLEIPKENRAEFESIYLETAWSEEVSPKLGTVLSKENINNISEAVERTLADFTSGELLQLRNDTVANFGCSASAIVDFISKKLDKKPQNS